MQVKLGELSSLPNHNERIEVLAGRVNDLEDKLSKLYDSYQVLWSEHIACRTLQSKHHQVRNHKKKK